MLSSERDRAYFCQLEQIPLDSYEHVLTRCTGRAGNTPFGKVYADCNPGPPHHWILERVKAGTLKMFKTTHRDNPRLWDGDWTRYGKMSMDALDRLTGVRRKRLKDGVWAGVEGLVYEMFDESKHIIDPVTLGDDWQRAISIDWGFRDPMVVQFWASKGEDVVLYREIYMTGQSVEQVAKRAGELSKNERIAWAVSDVDPQKQMTFRNNFGRDLMLYAANKKAGSVENGIHDYVEPALTHGTIKFFRNALVQKDHSLDTRHLPTCTVDEFGAYAWPEDPDGRPRKEVPIDANNHGMDAMRYYMVHRERMKQHSGNAFGGF